jgi:hypothetical protein
LLSIVAMLNLGLMANRMSTPNPPNGSEQPFTGWLVIRVGLAVRLIPNTSRSFCCLVRRARGLFRHAGPEIGNDLR